MIENKLEIILITYNRAKYVRNTLNQFLESPFKNCKFTILNNNSTDNTEEIYQEFKDKFPNLHLITNKYNIGGDPNILRAYETSDSEYTWVIADNDDYNFSNCEDVIEAINSEKYPVILTCSGFKKNATENPLNHLNGQSIYAKDLLKEGNALFDIFTFLPSLILNTSNINEELIQKGYNNTQNLFPHLPITIKILKENQLIYKSKEDLVIFNENPEEASYFSTMKLVAGRINSATIIEDETIKSIYLKEVLNHSLLLISIYTTLVEKINGENKNKELKIAILNAKGFLKGFIYIIILSIVSLTPTKICKFIVKKGEGRN